MTNFNPNQKIISAAWRMLVGSCFFLNPAYSCAEADMQQFVRNIQQRKPSPIQPLPGLVEFKTYRYTAQVFRSPFEPFITAMAVKLPPLSSDKGPDLNRFKEPLESYPLDTLCMVGTIAGKGSLFALVKDKQGIVHRVTQGNHLGQNFGKIQKITESTIEIMEWVVSSQGNYEERAVLMQLSC